MGVTPVIGDHVDVRVGTTVSPVGCANFEHPGRRVRFINQVMAIGITTPEGRAVPGAQCFFARIGDERQFAIGYPDELVLMAVPMTLAGPSTRLDDRHVHAELSQSRMTRQPSTRLSDARLIERTRIYQALHTLCKVL
jgi:hypothetical protein